MTRTLALFACCIALALTALPHVATGQVLLESLSVPTDGTSVSSSTTLSFGQTFELRASGTFATGAPGDGLADAEYADFSAPLLSLIDTVGSVDLGIDVDGVSQDWGDFNLSHQYSLIFVGGGAPVSFSYADNYYGDNRGELTVDIFRSVPEPASTTLAGLLLLATGSLSRPRRS